MHKLSISSSTGILLLVQFGMPAISHAEKNITAPIVNVAAPTAKETLIAKRSMQRPDNDSTEFRYFVISPNHKRVALMHIVKSRRKKTNNIDFKKDRYPLTVDVKLGRTGIDIYDIVFNKDSKQITL